MIWHLMGTVRKTYVRVLQSLHGQRITRNMEELVKTPLSEVETWFQLHTPINVLQGFVRKGNLSFFLTVR